MSTNISDTAIGSGARTRDRRVVSRDEWVAERRTLLIEEKELTRRRDEIARKRRALPCVRVDEAYVFVAPEGRRTLADLFGDRGQLLVQHFMLGPDWKEGCPSCSFMADHMDGMNVHLANRDVANQHTTSVPAQGPACQRVQLPAPATAATLRHLRSLEIRSWP